MNQIATGGCFPLCGVSYQITGMHGLGICRIERPYQVPPLTEDDIRRIVREELQRAKELGE